MRVFHEKIKAQKEKMKGLHKKIKTQDEGIARTKCWNTKPQGITKRLRPRKMPHPPSHMEKESGSKA